MNSLSGNHSHSTTRTSDNCAAVYAHKFMKNNNKSKVETGEYACLCCDSKVLRVQPSYTWLKDTLKAYWKKGILWLSWRQSKHRGLGRCSGGASSRDSPPFPWKSRKSSSLWTDSTTNCSVRAL